MPQVEITKVVFLHYDIVNNQYQQLIEESCAHLLQVSHSLSH